MVFFIGTFTPPESIRWLLSQDRTDDAWSSIIWIRGGDTPKTREEFAETQLGFKLYVLSEIAPLSVNYLNQPTISGSWLGPYFFHLSKCHR